MNIEWEIVMSYSDLLDFISIIISLATVITSIVIALKTLKQNNIMLEETTRPYISLSYEAVSMGVTLTYIMIKNYGQTAAEITQFAFDEKNIGDEDLLKKLKNVPGMVLAPGQKMLYTFKQNKIDEKDEYDKSITFIIEYKSLTKTYCERQTVSLRTGYYIERSLENDSKVDVHTLQVLQEIAERLI